MLQCSRIPVTEIVTAMEGGLKRSGSTLAQQARTRIAGLLAKSRPPPSNFHPAECKALKNLKADETIVIAPSDKGNVTVVMDLSDYDRKIRDLLTDTDTYESLSRDPAPAQKRKMNYLLLSLTRSGAIPGPLYKCLRSSAGQVPRLYVLPKVHKTGAPLRPIVSFIGSPTYCLSWSLSCPPRWVSLIHT